MTTTMRCDCGDSECYSCGSAQGTRDSFSLKHFAYCGMSRTIEDRETMADARWYAARYIRLSRREGFKVATLARGSRWEVLEPEGAYMVPDECGTLEIVGA